MKSITLNENDGYRLSVEISRCAHPSNLYELKFIKEYDLDERMNSYDCFFLTKDQLDKLGSIVTDGVSDMCKPKCGKCGFINNMRKEPPVIICSSCAQMLSK